jgi:hypothetical protein
MHLDLITFIAFCGLFNDCIIARQYSVERVMNDEMERIWKGAIVVKWSYYPGICLEGPRKTTNNLKSGYPVS